MKTFSKFTLSFTVSCWCDKNWALLFGHGLLFRLSCPFCSLFYLSGAPSANDIYCPNINCILQLWMLSLHGLKSVVLENTPIILSFSQKTVIVFFFYSRWLLLFDRVWLCDSCILWCCLTEETADYCPSVCVCPSLAASQLWFMTNNMMCFVFCVVRLLWKD